MDKNTGLVATKPISVWQKPIKADFKQLFKALGKGIIDGAFQNWKSVGLDLADATFALGIDTKPEELSWCLIYSSLSEALKQLIEDNENLMRGKRPSYDQLEISCLNIKNHIDEYKLTIDVNFFLNPKKLPILEEIKPYLIKWLEHFVDTPEAKAISNRLPSYFVLALHEEWRRSNGKYSPISDHIDTPFTKASEREHEWLKYSVFLQSQIEERMFNEAFGLKQVYVPLCAYYVKKPQEQRTFKNDEHPWSIKGEDIRCVVDLVPTLRGWLDKTDRNDAIRLISGGPGCGKSSFTKYFVANLAENDDLRVIFIPLHQFDPSSDLVESVGKYLKDTRLLSFNPLEPEEEETRLLIVFDGLDELAMQGQWGAEVAQNFLLDVSRNVERFNLQKIRVNVLISGRELVIQKTTEFKREGQILHILPYFIPIEERIKYVDQQALLDEDRRNIWWEKYGKNRDLGYTQLPEPLKNKNLIEITSQPLLNYLVALSYARKSINFSDKSNLNEVYADLLTSVYERDWENNQHPSLEKVSKDNFTRILEEIAVSAWHRNGRKTTVKEIQSRCNSFLLKQQFALFTKGAEEGVTRLLTAFYFRQSGWRESEYTFEFTHKSFGEYLISRRIVREIERIHRMLNKDELDECWDEKRALYHWIDLCGALEIDAYVFKFISDEVALRIKETVEAWQETFCNLIGYILNYSMPMELIDPRPRYHEECKQARNAEEALLAIVSACARRTGKLSRIHWPNRDSFSFWFGTLQNSRSGSALVTSCLNHLFLDNCNLNLLELNGASLDGASLNGASLDGASLNSASLDGASLNGASLNGASLITTSLVDTRLNRASLSGAHLYKARLDRAYLNYANLEAAILDDAILIGANLEGAVLDRASLNGTRLDRASLVGTSLNDVCLDKASLTGSIRRISV